MDSLPFGPFRDLQMLLASTFLPRLYQMQCPNGNFVPYVQVPKRPVPFTQIPCMRGLGRWLWECLYFSGKLRFLFSRSRHRLPERVYSYKHKLIFTQQWNKSTPYLHCALEGQLSWHDTVFVFWTEDISQNELCLIEYSFETGPMRVGIKVFNVFSEQSLPLLKFRLFLFPVSCL